MPLSISVSLSSIKYYHAIYPDIAQIILFSNIGSEYGGLRPRIKRPLLQGFQMTHFSCPPRMLHSLRNHIINLVTLMLLAEEYKLWSPLSVCSTCSQSFCVVEMLSSGPVILPLRGSQPTLRTYSESVGFSWLYLSELEVSGRVKSALEPHGHSRPFAQPLHPAGRLWPVQKLDEMRPLGVQKFSFRVISPCTRTCVNADWLLWSSDISFAHFVKRELKAELLSAETQGNRSFFASGTSLVRISIRKPVSPSGIRSTLR
jgi:hypothetical protein